MNDRPADADELDVLAEDFLARQRRGESPSVEQYAASHPDLAEEIRDLFPAMAAMERLKARGERTSDGSASLGPVKLERLGDFRIIREIGRGGMGIVFEAEQESLGRRVALKVLPRQALLERRHLARFKREARLASRLHHTNIVQVYGVGDEDGFHYYVMQYVRGVGLDKVVGRLGRPGDESQGHPRRDTQELGSASIESEHGQDAHGQDAHATHGQDARATAELLDLVWESLAGSGPSPLADAGYYRRVAGIGVQAAEALSYANEQGTLHRDVKPANVLMDDHGVVWVTDFGLARAVHSPEVTQPGDLTGTLRYLAPERLRGQADARGDVYGLGLTLYELLTGRCAYDESDRASLIREISETSPPAPRRINPSIPRDLETVVLKAIAREPDRRYASAGDLAADLRRFIEDRPILARRVGPGERLWRWCRRNRAVAGLSAATLLLVVAVAVVASVGYIRTRGALAGESEQRRKAEAIADLARDAIDRVFDRLGSYRPDASASLQLGDGNDTSVEIPRPAVASKASAALMEEMLPFYDRLARHAGGDESLALRAADATRRIGDIRQRLGQYSQAAAAFGSAIEMYLRQAGADSANSDRLLVAAAGTYNELGRTYRLERKLEKARQAHLQVLNVVVDPDEASAAGRFELAKAYYGLGRHVAPDPGLRAPGQGGPGRPDGPAGRGPRGGPGFRQDDAAEGGTRRQSRGGGPGRFAPSRREGPEGPAGEPNGDRADGGPFGRRKGLAPPRGPDAPQESQEDWRVRREYLARSVVMLDRLVGEAPDNSEYRHLLALCYREGRDGAGPREIRQAARQEGMDRAIEILESLVKEHPEVAEYRFDLIETYAMTDGLGPPDSREGPAGLAQRLRKAMALSVRLVAEHPGVPEYRASQAHINQKLGQVLRRMRRVDEAEQADRRAIEAQAALAAEFPEVVTYRVWLAAFRNSLAGGLLRRKPGEARALAESNIANMSLLLAEHPELWYLHALLADANDTLAAALRGTGQGELADQAEREAQRHRQELRPATTATAP